MSDNGGSSDAAPTYLWAKLVPNGKFYTDYDGYGHGYVGYGGNGYGYGYGYGWKDGDGGSNA